MNLFICLLTCLIPYFFFFFFFWKACGVTSELLKVSRRLACKVRASSASCCLSCCHVNVWQIRIRCSQGGVLRFLVCLFFVVFFPLAANSHSRPGAQLTLPITTAPQQRSHVRLAASVWRLSLSDVNHILRSGKQAMSLGNGKRGH